MRRPRILLAVVRFFAFGGMQRTLARIAARLVADGAEVVIAAARADAEPPPGVAIRHLPARAFTNHGRNKAFAARVAELVRAESFDLVVGFNKMPGLDVYYAGDSCYAEHAARRPGYAWMRLTPRHRAYLSLEASVFRRGAGTEILLIAHGEREKFIARYDAEPERFHLLPPGIDAARLELDDGADFDRAAFRRALGVDPDASVLLTVGSGFRTKGVDRVIDAMARLADDLKSRTYYVVAGADRNARKYETQARRLGLVGRVKILGPRSDVAALYRAADLLVHPARLENTGTTLLEAMMVGLPVVASGVCGFSYHVIAAGAGLVLTEPFEAEDLDAVLHAALTSASPLPRLWSRNGLGYAASKDFVGLIESAAAIILDRARSRVSATQGADVESGADARRARGE